MLRKINTFFALFLACGAVLADTIATVGGIELDFPDGYQDRKAAAAYWKDIDVMLVRYFSASKTGLSRNFRIEFDDRKPFAYSDVSDSIGCTTFRLSGPVSVWRGQSDALRAICGAALAARYGLPVGTAVPLPAWILGAFESTLRCKSGFFYAATDAETRITEKDGNITRYIIRQPVRRTRYNPGLRFLRSQNALPQLSELMAVNPARLPYEIRLVAEDLSRFYLEQLFRLDGRGKILSDYLIADRTSSPGQAYAAALKPACLNAAVAEIAQNAVDDAGWDEDRKIRFYFESIAERAAFNSSFPYPAALALERLAAWRKTTLKAEETHKDGRVVDLSELPSSGLPDVQLQLLGIRKQKELLLLSEGFGDESGDAVDELASQVLALPSLSRWFGPWKLRRRIAAVEKTLRQRAAREEAVDAAERAAYQGILFQRGQLRIVRENGPDALSRDAKAFVDATERNYLAEP